MWIGINNLLKYVLQQFGIDGNELCGTEYQL